MTLVVQNRESIKAAGWIIAFLGLAAVFAAGMLRISACFELRKRGVRYPADLRGWFIDVNPKKLKSLYAGTFPKGLKIKAASFLYAAGFVLFAIGGLMIAR